MHYDGPGAGVPGAPVGGYGYDVRTEGMSSRDDDAPAVEPMQTVTVEA